ncbi:MAG: glycosyltransferase, partial [Pseudomonadota bacterium]
VVNDNPGDRTASFAEETAARYGARVIHHEVNRGLSAARNTGIDAAAGDLATFLDSDDYYAADGLARHLAFAEAEGATMAHAPTIVKTLRGETRHVDWDGKLFLARRPARRPRDVAAAQFIASSWSSIYETAFLKTGAIRFDEAQRRFEDRLFVLEAVLAAPSLAFMGADEAGPIRVYRRRPGSITTAAKAGEDRALQAALSRKCVDLLAEAAAEGRAPVAWLRREAMVCLQRLMMNTGLADPALDGDEEAEAARAVFARLFADHPLDPAIFDDPVFRPLLKVGDRFEDGRPVTREDLTALHEAVRAGDWAAAGRVYQSVKLPPRPARPFGGAGREAELILHIGLHKTGTTHAQRRFEASRDALGEAGVLFPRTGFRGDQPMNARAGATPGHLGVVHAIQNDNAEFAGRFYAEIDEALPAAEKVLVSAENLSNPLRADRGRAGFAAQAEDFFAGLPRRRVIALIRRPDLYLDAYYRELVFLGTEHWRKAPDRFAFEHADMAVNYEALFRRWAEFAGDRLRLGSYDEARETGAAEALLNLAGIEGVALDEDERPTYPTPSRSLTLAARTVAAATPMGPARSRALACFWRIAADVPAEAEEGPLLSPLIRKLALERSRDASADFLAAHGLTLPFDRWLAEVDEAPHAPATIAAAHLEAAQLALEIGRSDVQPPPTRTIEGPPQPQKKGGVVSLWRRARR